MLSQTEAIIYLADQRGCSQKEWYRSYHTFNFGDYQHASRKPVGNLQALNDDTLKGGRTLTLPIKEDATVLLLPVVGALHYKNSMNIQGTVDAGNAHLLFLPKESSLEISNPYADELINFLQLWFTPDPQRNPSKVNEFEFDLSATKNRLIPLQSTEKCNSQHARTFIGKFDGRKEGTHQLRNPGKGIFIFIIEGAFEVQNRLLQPRDGLAIWDTEEIEFEALSNEAIILLFE